MAAPKSLNEAILAFQSEQLSLEKDSTNPAFGRGSKYISLDAALPKIIEKLNALGVIVTQSPSAIGFENPTPALTTVLTHVASGDTLETTMPLVLDKNTAQGQGSGITYARRYCLLPMLGLVAETDDDGGNTASKVEVVNHRTPSDGSRKATPKTDDDTAGY